VLTKYERETIITFNDEEQYAHIYTLNRALKNKLKKLSKKHPEEFILLCNDGESVTYRFPKNLVSVRGVRKRPEEKQGTAEKMEIPKYTRKNRIP